VIALELAVGLVEGATPALASSVAHGYALHDMRAHVDSLQAAHRLPPSRATLERIANRVAGAGVKEAMRIEAIVRRTEKLTPDAVAISIGLDRTSTLMIEDRPSDAPAKPPRMRRKPRVRRPPAPYDINWRMAYVGTVSFVDAAGDMLATIRYAAAACDDPRELVEKMSADVRSALKRRPSLHVGIVQDGAHEMWNRTREGLRALHDDGRLDTWYERIDLYHLLERLAESLNIVAARASEQARKDRLQHWREIMDETDNAIDYIEAFLIDGSAIGARWRQGQSALLRNASSSAHLGGPPRDVVRGRSRRRDRGRLR